jgi:di/tricarboxylate transporter
MRTGFDPGGSRRYGIVLALVVANILFIAIAPNTGASRLVSTTLSGAVALAAMWAAGVRPRRQQFVRVLVGAAIVGAVIAQVEGSSAISRGLIALGSGAFVVLAPLVICRGLLRHVTERGVDMSAVAGALAIYMLIGLFFAFLVAGVSELSSAPYFAQHAGNAPTDDVYFSFVTLTTVGYGDYTPALGIGRGLSILEGVTGQLYLVTVVALLIGNLRGRHTERLAGPGVEAEG